MNTLAVNHPQTIPTGPAGSENDKVDAIEGTSPMILNATANTCAVEYCLFSSCLYPILASLFELACNSRTPVKITGLTQ